MFKEKKSENKRKKMIAKIHIGKKYLGLNEDDYKVFLKASAGKESTTDMTVEELKEVLNSMNVAGAFATGGTQCGQTPQSSSKNQKNENDKHFYVTYQDTKYLTEKQVKFIKGLWWKKSNNPSENTLKVFIKRITGKNSLSECGHKEANILITAIQEIKAKPTV
ncbi:phage protein GemA/Gp16 family protein [Brachyspira pulli]|uniref:phage protein GemA/Gp16 family protein n=1 Tax=Brachyspira pulli TaxID=310721 RepID=UPI003004B091